MGMVKALGTIENLSVRLLRIIHDRFLISLMLEWNIMILFVTLWIYTFSVFMEINEVA